MWPLLLNLHCGNITPVILISTPVVVQLALYISHSHSLWLLLLSPYQFLPPPFIQIGYPCIVYWSYIVFSQTSLFGNVHLFDQKYEHAVFFRRYASENLQNGMWLHRFWAWLGLPWKFDLTPLGRFFLCFTYDFCITRVQVHGNWKWVTFPCAVSNSCNSWNKRACLFLLSQRMGAFWSWLQASYN